MKAFAVILLSIFAAVQGRSAGAQVVLAPVAAAPGENPWVVHNRVAVSTSGLLNSCVGSLISDRWVLTSANCVTNQRFIWLRYGAVNVIQPELVTETGTVRVHPDFNPSTGDNDIALISINRAVQSTDNISPVTLASSDAEVPSSARLCAYGTSEGPGEQLLCADVDVEQTEEGNIVAATGASQFDIGAPLVSDGIQYGILSTTNEDGESVFTSVSPYLSWIRSIAGVPAVEEEEDNSVVVADYVQHH